MRIDGIQLQEGSNISNLVVASGPSFPASPDEGELFFRSDLDGLYVYNSSAWVAVSTGDQTITLTGDVTGTGTGSFVATLATVNTNVGSFTNTNITIDAKGRITAASSGSGGGVTSVNAQTGAVVLSTTNITEGSNLYYTNTRARDAISVTGGGSYDNATGVITISTAGAAAAGTLTGTTLASNVVSSSLTSVGTLASLAVTGAVTGASFTGAHSGSGALLTAIPNGALTNSSVTVGSTNIALGATSTTLAGLTSVTSTSFVGPLAGNASTATTAGALTTARTINGVSFDGTTNITVPAAAGTLTGSVIPSNVVTSSLTTLGTITALVAGTANITSTLTAVTVNATTLTGNGTAITTTSTGAMNSVWQIGRGHVQPQGTPITDVSGTFNGLGQPVRIYAGQQNSGASGGYLLLAAGDGASGSTNGGHTYLKAGDAGVSGGSSTGVAGSVYIMGGANSFGAGTPGNIIISTSGTERFRILANGAWSVGTGGAAYGTSGQVLTSAGNATPTWTTFAAAAGTITGTTLASNVVTSSLTSVGTVTSGTWSGLFGAVSGANLTTLNATNLSSGTVAVARLGSSGTANSTTFLRGDNTWAAVSAALSNNQVGYGASGVLASSSNFTFTTGSNTLLIGGPNTIGILFGGDSTGSAVAGGSLRIRGGFGGATAAPGNIEIQAGDADGATSSTNGGNIILRSGYGTGAGTSVGGSIQFQTAVTGSFTEKLRITNTGALALGGTASNYGTSGQVLTSSGNGSPTWSTPSAGGGGFFTSYTTTGTSKTLVAGELCVPTANTLTLTLPASPTAGMAVGIRVRSAITGTIIARNGQNINELAEDMTLNMSGVTVTLIYINATDGWIIQ